MSKKELMDVDAMMSELYGEVGTPEREQFRMEAYNYCVGQIVSEARKREKITQQELAESVGVTKSYISRIEKGHVDPSAGLFLRIIACLGLNITSSELAY